MLSSDQRWFSSFAVAAVALLPVSAEAQTMGRSFEELVPSAAKPVVVIDKAAQETRSGAPEVSFESFEPLTGPVSLWPTTMARGWLERAVGREVSRLARSTAFADSTLRGANSLNRRSAAGSDATPCCSVAWSASAAVFLSAICRAMTASWMTSRQDSMVWYWEGSGQVQERR